MATIGLLYKDRYNISSKVSVVIPTVGQIMEDEDRYYEIVSVFTSMPIDMIAALSEAGIDFTSINEWDLFLMLFSHLRTLDTKYVLGDIDLNKFNMYFNKDTDSIELRDDENDIVIDRGIHEQIALVLRTIHHLEKNTKRPGNDEAKEYLIERAKAKAARNKHRSRKSQLEPLIVAMVNAEQYKYDYEGTKNLTIYQFNQSVRQIIKKVDYDNLMHGVYAGTIDAKGINQDKLNWLSDNN